MTTRVLALRAAGLGDLLTVVPALRALKHGLPRCHLTLAAPAPLASLVEDVVDDVVDVRAAASPAGLTELGRRTGHHDLAINLHGRGPQSHRALTATMHRTLVGYACPPEFPDGPAWRSHEHEVDRWCRLVTTLLGVPPDPRDLFLERSAATRTGTVVVHPGASTSRKWWPAERFAAVARAMSEDGYPVVVTGSRSEGQLVASVVAQAGLPSEADLSGRTDVSGLRELVGSAALVVCNDTGVGHLATAMRTPSVLLFGPTDPSTWGPRSGPHTVIRRRLISDISETAVVAAARARLSERVAA